MSRTIAHARRRRWTEVGQLAFSLRERMRRLMAVAGCSIVLSTAPVHAATPEIGIKRVVVEAVDVSELNSLSSESLAERIFPENEPVARSSSFTGDAVAPHLGKVVKKAETMIGIPYQWGGNTPEEGLDCSGFVRYVYQKVTGILLPRLSVQISRKGVAVAQPDLHPGDLVFFNTPRGEATHVGIYVGEKQFIHAPKTGALIRVESMKSAYWTARYYGARRVIA